MNILHKLTLKELMKNRTRTIVTIIGIMLSTSMIVAVTTFAKSLQQYMVDEAVYRTGDWHANIKHVSQEEFDKINAIDEINHITYNQILGYAKIENNSEFKPYLYIIGAKDNTFFEDMSIHLTTGEYPKNSNEILIPDNLLIDGANKTKTGDEINLDIGYRILDNEKVWQDIVCYDLDETSQRVKNNEELEIIQTKTFTVVGTYTRLAAFEDYMSPGYTAITLSDDQVNNSLYDIYFKVKNPRSLYEVIKANELVVNENRDVLMYQGITRHGRFIEILLRLCIIVITLIMIGSIALIYNAFAISVSERTKQFGLLSSVGATKRQLRKMVFFEVLAVSVVGIPLGTIAGIAGIGVTLALIGDKFNFFSSNLNMPLRMSVSAESILIAVAVALVTIIISAWLPSKKATRVSAIEAIRQNNLVKAKNKQVKTSKITYKLFGLPGVIATKHYKRNRKKYRTTVASLFISIVLFVSASTFSDYLTEAADGGLAANNFELEYAINYDDIKESTPNDIEQILYSDENVNNVTYSISNYFNGFVPIKYANKEFYDLYTSRGERIFDDSIEINGVISFVREDEFEKLIDQYNLKHEDYYDKTNPCGIAIDVATVFSSRNEKFVTTDSIEGDYCEVSFKLIKDEYSDYTSLILQDSDDEDEHVIIEFGSDKESITIKESEAYDYHLLKANKMITDYPDFIKKKSYNSINFIYPESMMESVIPKGARRFYSYNYFIKSDNHARSYENLSKVLRNNNLDDGYIIDVAASEETERNTVTIIRVFSYGFIALISLIAVANVFNTITTNVNLRKREFAILKSVGMTQKGFNKMMNFECVLYGSKAILLGLPVATIITILMYNSVAMGYDTAYHFPIKPSLISIFSVFLVVFLAMLFSMSKIKKENPIDVLKNENI